MWPTGFSRFLARVRFDEVVHVIVVKFLARIIQHKVGQHYANGVRLGISSAYEDSRRIVETRGLLEGRLTEGR